MARVTMDWTVEAKFAEVPTIPSNWDLNHSVIGDRRPLALSGTGRRDLEAQIASRPAQRRVSGARSSVCGISARWEGCDHEK